MKKIISATLAFAMAILAIGCSSRTDLPVEEIEVTENTTVVEISAEQNTEPVPEVAEAETEESAESTEAQPQVETVPAEEKVSAEDVKKPEATKGSEETAAPVTTTKAPAVTTKAPEKSKTPAATTKAPEKSKAPAATTKAPEKSKTPAVTTTVPETTKAPAVTTKAPETTKAPAVTTTVPETTKAPAVTTTVPETTTAPMITTEPEIVRLPEVNQTSNGVVTINSQEELNAALLKATMEGKTTLGVNITNSNLDYFSYNNFDYLLGCSTFHYSGYGYGYGTYTIRYRSGEKVANAYKNGNLSSLSSSEKELYNKAASIVASCTSSSDSDAEKARALHDYLVNNCCYDRSFNDISYSAEGALFNHTAVCSGYSDAYRLLLTLAGVESYTVTGDATNSSGNTGGHAWNLVNLDGRWVYIDVTWDDPITYNGQNMLRYDYFAISESEISGDHFWNTDVTDMIRQIA